MSDSGRTFRDISEVDGAVAAVSIGKISACNGAGFCAPATIPVRPGVSAFVWAVTVSEHALLVAWKFWGIAGAGNLLTAWVVIAGLLGFAMLFGPPGEISWSAESVFGLRVVRMFDLAMAAALFWFGHGLLGVLWLAALGGGYAYAQRSARHRRGGAHG